MSPEILLGVFTGVPFGIIIGLIVGAHLEHRAWQRTLEILPDILSKPEVAQYLADVRRAFREGRP